MYGFIGLVTVVGARLGVCDGVCKTLKCENVDDEIAG
jgi:hypothetical protein